MILNFTEEEKMLKAMVKKLADEKIMPLAQQVDRSSEIPWDLVKVLADHGLLAICIPREYGGTAEESVKAVPLCIVREELSRASEMASVIFTSAVLAGRPLIMGGSEELKREYLPRLAKGEILLCFSLSEPEAGSDAAALKTTATPDGDHFVLNGVKCYASLGISSPVVVMARTDPSVQGAGGVSAFLVEQGTPGFESRSMGELLAPHEMAELTFTNCRVPSKNLLGNPGEGFKLALGSLNIARITVGAHAVGLAQAAFDLALEYAKTRVQFGQRIADFQLIQAKLADMAVMIESARYMVYHAAWIVDQGARARKESSMAKLYATEMSQKVVYEAQQIFGGYGVLERYPIELLGRRVRSCTLYEGTSEIQRTTIARELLNGY